MAGVCKTRLQRQSQGRGHQIMSQNVSEQQESVLYKNHGEPQTEIPMCLQEQTTRLSEL